MTPCDGTPAPAPAVVADADLAARLLAFLAGPARAGTGEQAVDPAVVQRLRAVARQAPPAVPAPRGRS